MINITQLVTAIKQTLEVIMNRWEAIPFLKLKQSKIPKSEFYSTLGSFYGHIHSQEFDYAQIERFESQFKALAKFINSNSRQITLALGKEEYDKLSKNITEIIKEFEMLKRYYSVFFKLILLERNKIVALMLELGVHVKPEIKNIYIKYADPNFVGCYRPGGILIFSINLCSEYPQKIFHIVAHELAHSMQPTLKWETSLNPVQLMHLKEEIDAGFELLLKAFNILIKGYNWYLFPELRALNINLKRVPLLPEGVLGELKNELEGYHIEKEPNFNRIQNVFITCLREFSKNLKIADRILSFKSKKDPDARTLLKCINDGQNKIAKFGNELMFTFAQIKKRSHELINYDPNRKIREGFATVIEYLYAKKYNIPGVEAAIPSLYLPSATRAYVLYMKDPAILKGIFVGNQGSSSTWQSIAVELDKLSKEFATINFKTGAKV
jgi:hypothetical protein